MQNSNIQFLDLKICPNVRRVELTMDQAVASTCRTNLKYDFSEIEIPASATEALVG